MVMGRVFPLFLENESARIQWFFVCAKLIGNGNEEGGRVPALSLPLEFGR